MLDEKYRVERILRVFTFIMIGVILFTALTFFGVIDTSTAGSHYCIAPKYFECEGLTIKPTSIALNLSYEGPDLLDVKITSENADCARFEKNLFETKKELNVRLKCSLTAPKAQSFKDELLIEYTGGRSVGLTKEIIRIKSRVK